MKTNDPPRQSGQTITGIGSSEAAQEASLPLPAEGEAWWILHTRPRAEKKIVETFQREGVRCYLPLRRKDHRYGNRIRVFWSPLFTGYVFALLPVKKVSAAKSNGHVANVLQVVDQPSLVHQLNQIRQALDTGEYLEVMPSIKEGRRVRITGGAFIGVEGIVERFEKKTKVIIGIEMIQQSVLLEVDSCFVEVV